MLGGFVMNLTLKQLFKFGVVCASACALSASAVNYVSDSFEAPDGVDGKAIGEYKLNDPVLGVTNWIAGASDASTIVTNDPSYALYSGGHPIAGTDELLILNLDTQGTELTRPVTNNLDLTSADVYVDTLVQFVLSEAAPTIDTSELKVALYVNAESNLVVVSSMYTDPPTLDWTPIETNSIITSVGPIDPAQWYRLSMRVTYDAPDTLTDIYLDGTLITHANAYDIDNVVNGGSSFLSIDATYTDIDSISFAGTGMLDELVVSDTAPVFGTPTVIQLVFAGPVGSSVIFATSAVPGTPVTQVPDETEIIMTASDWYEVDTVTGPITQAGDIAPNAQVVTTTVTAVSGSCTVTANVAQVIGNPAIWALDNGISEAEFAAGTYEDNYLLNISTGEVASIKITSIVVDGSVTTIEVGSDAPVNFEDLYGTLIVEDSSDLVSWAEAGSYGVTPGDTVTITNGLDFIKAIVE
jgi:hypothetical protein